MERLLLAVILVFIPAPRVHAQCGSSNFLYYCHTGIESIVGTIKSIGRNKIEVYDEENQINRSFIYLRDNTEFTVGERVRLYYYPMNNVVQNLKKETPVEYRKNSQNLGYISKAQ